MNRDKVLITTGLTASSFSLFFQSDTLLSFLTIRESLTYTALLTLKRCSNYSIKKKVCILQSSTRKAGRMSCNVFPSSTFHPWLFFMFTRFCKWGEILLVRSRTQALWWSHLFKGFVQVPQGITIMLGQNPSTWSCRRCCSWYWAQFPLLRGESRFSGVFRAMCAGKSHGQQNWFWHHSVSCGTSLTNHNSSRKHWSNKPSTSYFLDKIGVFQIYLKGSFWILLKVKLDIPDQRILLFLFTDLPLSTL